MAKTMFGEDDEAELLKELDPIVKKWTAHLQSRSNIRIYETYVEESIAYLWKYRATQAREDYRKWLSANDMGIYGGR